MELRLLLFALLATYIQSYQSKLLQCQGTWNTPETILSAERNTQYQSFSPMSFNNYGNLSDLAHSLIQKFDLCPLEELIFNCAYRNVTDERRSRIENRIWIPHNNKSNNIHTNQQESSCQSFNPKKFLSLIANRRVLFAGDSTVFQAWSSLVCSLSRVSRIDQRASRVKWQYNEWLEGACPLGKFHCHMDHGSVHFPEYNTTIVHHKFVIYQDTPDASVQGMLERHRMRHMDILFFNFGLWVEDKIDYRRLVGEFLADVHHLERVAAVASSSSSSSSSSFSSSSSIHSSKAKLPHIFFLETFPQHFPTANGYFNRTDSSLLWAPCKPLSLYNYSVSVNRSNPTISIPGGKNSSYYIHDKYEVHNTSSDHASSEHWREVHDWRNAVARDEIAKSGVSIDVVSLAEGLYSQWDAHVDLIEVPPDLEFDFVHVADCTHYCSHAAVFQFVKTALQHALISVGT